jgi:ATP-binding cassette subfamily B protein
VFDVAAVSLNMPTPFTASTRGNTLTSAEPGGDKAETRPETSAGDRVSGAEQELYGGRLRYDQAFVRHERPLTRLGFGHMAAALPHMVVMVLRTGWQTDRRALTAVVTAQLGQGAAAGWGLMAVNRVLTELFADGPTAGKLRDALPSLAVLAVTAVATALLAAWSTVCPAGWSLRWSVRSRRGTTPRSPVSRWRRPSGRRPAA